MTDHGRLSEAGERRRAAMLSELQGELSRVRRRRARREVVGGAALALVVCALVGLLLHAMRAPTPAPTPIVAHQTPPPEPPPAPEAPAPDRPSIAVAIVHTDPTILGRTLARPSMSGLEVLSDDQLLAEMRAAGRDCGLIKMDGRAWLTCDGG